jgi:ADP-dependent NAD(P)H-hydrate dehydratase / NAD(P)H-hydrate epimerase
VSGLLPLYDADEIRALDSAAIEGLGLPGAVLMERAGLAAAHEIGQRFPSATRVAIVCGSGNNGGDGFVVARHLHSSGTSVEVLLTGVASKLSIDARTNLEAAERLGVRITRRPATTALRAALRRSEVVVDAVFGVGFRGRARGDAAGVIAAINGSGRPVVSLDVPSGVDASNGTVEGEAVVAAFTIAFHGPKLGLIVAPGSHHAGAVVVADIGIPTQLERPTHAALATRDLLDRVPPKTSASTKYSAGSVLVVGGAPGYAGAPVLCATAALRAGAGVAWLAVPDEQVAQIEGLQPELMVRPRQEGLDLASRAGALALGPGLGRSEEAVALARRLARGHSGSIVIDADALFALAGRLELTARRRRPAVLTPHEGEMARLLERDAGWVQANRLAAVREAAATSRAVVLLKGADTLIAAPGGEHVVVSVSDAPGLATAGSGDVLTGVIAAMLARGLDPWTAACCGAVAHGRAGRAASETLGRDGIISSDVIAALPGVFAREVA